MSQTISSYFNPKNDLVFYTDKQGQLMSGGYQISNLLFENKVPLFASVGGGGGGGKDESNIAANIIPEKFSDLFKDLAVPAGLFMMPPLYATRKYGYEPRDDDNISKSNAKDKTKDKDTDTDTDSDSDSDTDSDSDNEQHPPRGKFAPTDIFDKLLEMVTLSDRIKLDNKTRNHKKINNTTTKQKSKTRRMRRNK